MTAFEGPPTAGRVAMAAASADRMADGEWHRLHPATPLLRGGIGFIAVLGFVIANLRERLTDMFIGLFGGNRVPSGGPGGRAPQYDGDPIDQLVNHGLVGWALVVLTVLLLLALGTFYLSWRMHTFRVGDDAVEVRSGILFRRHRKARLDRIQGVNVARPLFARIFGTAKLEVSVAGHDANVELSYLGSALADGLRRDILRLASGARAVEHGESRSDSAILVASEPANEGNLRPANTRATDLLTQRLNEFIAPELDPDAARPESVVHIPHLRLLGAIVLHGFTLFLIVVVVLLAVGVATGRFWLLFVVLPGLLGSAGFYGRRFTKSVNYSIAGTPDGIRVGFGLLSISNETLPPGRIHAIEVMQSLLWRPFGWWQIRIDTAGHSKEKGAAGQKNTTILPVGDRADVVRVLGLMLTGVGSSIGDELIDAGMTARVGGGYSGTPRRAAWIRPFSWRRTGYAIVDGNVLLRSGALWRRLVVVPLARLQSVELSQGPVERMLSLASAHLHTVEGPVRAHLPVIDPDAGTGFFTDVASAAVTAAEADATHHWHSTPLAPPVNPSTGSAIERAPASTSTDEGNTA